MRLFLIQPMIFWMIVKTGRNFRAKMLVQLLLVHLRGAAYVEPD